MSCLSFLTGHKVYRTTRHTHSTLSVLCWGRTSISLVSRFREDEVRAEMAEREVQKLQKEVDKLEVINGNDI